MLADMFKLICYFNPGYLVVIQVLRNVYWFVFAIFILFVICMFYELQSVLNLFTLIFAKCLVIVKILNVLRYSCCFHMPHLFFPDIWNCRHGHMQLLKWKYQKICSWCILTSTGKQTFEHALFLKFQVPLIDFDLLQTSIHHFVKGLLTAETVPTSMVLI